MEYIFIGILALGVSLFILLLVLAARSKSSRGQSYRFDSKGDYGEMCVSKILSQLSDEYLVFNDVYLNSNGYSIQIDHVVVSQYGVFVIETKNYSGDVYGSECARQWTQYLQGVGYKFRNPVLQNRSHELAIQEKLNIAKTSIIPIVVFLNGANLHCNTLSTVLYSNQLYDYILSNKRVMFTREGVERLSQRLSNAIVTVPNRKNDHVENVRQNIAERELQIARRKCPRCGGKLIERQGIHGHFLGCINYPYCRFTIRNTV